MPDPTDPPPAEPKSLFDRVIETTPIVLTVVATVFAGLSGSEMNLAMYWRSVAAQDQSLATDQWTLAGFKRDRALTVETAADALRAVHGAGPPPPTGTPAADWLRGDGPPTPELPPIDDPALNALLAAVRDKTADAGPLAARVPPARVTAAIAAAEAAWQRTDAAWGPVTKQAGEIARAGVAVNPDAAARVALQVAWLSLEGRRYRAEAGVNQQLGFLFEARVRVTAAVSDRHRAKSQSFFYVMLVAQAGVVIASVALARRKMSVFWVLASAAGVVAVLAGLYVYLTS